MSGLKKEGLVTEYEFKARGGENSVKAMISIDSLPYQNYLAANRNNARLREEYGYLTDEGLKGVREAVEQLNDYAMTLIRDQRRN